MGDIQGRYPDRKFKVGDPVLATHKHGNLERETLSHIPKEHIGQITGVFHLREGSKDNTSPEYPYKLFGHVAGWAEDELRLIPIDAVRKVLEHEHQ